MTYLIFKQDAMNKKNGWEDELSMLMLVDKNDLTIEQPDYSKLYARAFSKHTTTDLVLQLAFQQHQQKVAVIAVKFKRDIKTDKRLIAQYGDDYLGCVKKSVKKQDLLNDLEAQEGLREAKQLRNSLNPHLLGIKHAYTRLAISDAEVKELDDLAKQSIKPVNVWLDAFENKLISAHQAMPKLIERAF